MKYPIFDKLTQQQLGYFWRPEEVSLQKDRNDFQELPEQQKFIFTSNLKYQTMLDSVQGRGPCMAFLPFVSLPELEGAIVTWDFMETIHSRSYTYIIKNLYPNPADVFDTIIQDEKIEKRANSVTEQYDNLINMGYQWTIDKKKVDMYELKKNLYKTMVTVNILEGSAKIISFIARDESQHLAMSQTVINNWHDRNDDKDMLKIRKECEKEVYQMYDDALQQEKRWATYLFSKGSMIGLSEKLLHQFVEYMANRRMRGIGLNAVYEQKTNPLPWIDHWLNSRSLQNAPQETEIESYVIGGIKQDVKKDQFKKFKL